MYSFISTYADFLGLGSVMNTIAPSFKPWLQKQSRSLSQKLVPYVIKQLERAKQSDAG